MNFFMEVAKLRAARLLWAKLMKPFDPKDPRSLSLRTHSQTSGWSLTAQDVFNNVVAHLHRGDGGDARAHPVAAHQRARRGAGAADRLLRPHRPQHPARACSRKAAPPVIDPWGGSYYVERLTTTREEGLGPYPGGRRTGRHGEGDRGRHPQAAHRGGRRQGAGAHRRRRAVGDRRQQVPARERAPIDVLKVDNSAVRALQIDKLRGSSASATRRSEAALDALTRTAAGGNGNLLALAVDAARAKATVGEISLALEKVFGRHRAEIKAISASTSGRPA
jgi:methylmalonyl-CoA mutase